MNDVFSGGRTETANFTAYINPYLVVSKGGQYTKHIYIGSQRIVSKLGDLDSYGQDPRRIEYAGSGISNVVVDYSGKYKESQQTIKDNYDHFEVPYYGKDNDDYVNGSGFCCDDNPKLKSFSTGKNDNPELFQYYYHSDHLGSSSLITNLDGEVVQHIEYVPFGEVFIEERNNKWNTPYLFNAKELDEETGLYYYGARYYDPRTSVWLSTDPLQEKYPNISTYAYTFQNPVKYVDPDGCSGRAVINKENKTIIVHSKFIFYGSKAETKLSKSIANEIRTQYNNAKGEVTIDGVKYKVQFKITYQTVTESEAIKMAKDNKDAKNNFIRVEKNNSRYNRSFNELSGNAGFMNTDDNLGTSTTAPHEVGHGYGLEHPDGDQRGKGTPDIMAARGTLVDPEYQYDPKAKAGQSGGTLKPTTRKVNKQNITDMFKGVTFDKNGNGNIGKPTNTIFKSDGYEKTKE